MGRRTIGVVAAVLALVVPAIPATAKGIRRAHFSGPGLPADGLELVGVRGIHRTGLVAPKEKSLAALGVARDDLGAPYRATYRMDYAPRHPLRQVVYPYAEGGPVTFTPRGQHLGQDYESFRGGWFSSGSRLLRLLVAHGFPPKDPGDPIADHSEGQDSRSATMTTQSGTWNRWSLTVGALLLLVLVAIAVTRIHRDRRANTNANRLSREIASG